jgi:hypothetical protein
MRFRLPSRLSVHTYGWGEMMLETAIFHIGVDKLQHFFFYTVTAFALATTVCLIPPFANGFQRICAVWFSLIFIGMLEEYRQLLIPERTTEWRDAIANILGVSIGVLLPLLIHLKWRRSKANDVRLKRSFLPLGAAILFVLAPLLYGLTVVSEPMPPTMVNNKSLPVQNIPQHDIQKHEITSAENSLTSEAIIEKYRLKLEELQQYSNGNVEKLADEAISEWKAKPMTLTALYAKYVERANELEKQINAEFQQIYEAAKDDLQQHGFNPGDAEVLKKEYEDAKEAEKAAIMQKAATELF